MREIFSTPSSAHARTSVILAGKRDSRRHSTTSFSESVVVAETSYQVLHVLSFCCDREGDEPPLIKITVLTFKKCKIKLSGLSFFENTRKKVKSPF